MPASAEGGQATLGLGWKISTFYTELQRTVFDLGPVEFSRLES